MTINDERTRTYTMSWIHPVYGEVGFDKFKGKKSQLPEAVVVMTNEGQQACKLQEVKMVDGKAEAVYRCVGRSFRRWFAV